MIGVRRSLTGRLIHDSVCVNNIERGGYLFLLLKANAPMGWLQ